mmetsp:Transcript_48140/g.146412  ORF Transcript_48140/g.146412 Transcript_48140/m.146412 type:complete len:424 (+) Transcript_48140:467-1738(+)
MVVVFLGHLAHAVDERARDDVQHAEHDEEDVKDEYDAADEVGVLQRVVQLVPAAAAADRLEQRGHRRDEAAEAVDEDRVLLVYIEVRHGLLREVRRHRVQDEDREDVHREPQQEKHPQQGEQGVDDGVYHEPQAPEEPHHADDPQDARHAHDAQDGQVGHVFVLLHGPQQHLNDAAHHQDEVETIPPGLPRGAEPHRRRDKAEHQLEEEPHAEEVLRRVVRRGVEPGAVGPQLVDGRLQHVLGARSYVHRVAQDHDQGEHLEAGRVHELLHPIGRLLVHDGQRGVRHSRRPAPPPRIQLSRVVRGGREARPGEAVAGRDEHAHPGARRPGRRPGLGEGLARLAVGLAVRALNGHRQLLRTQRAIRHEVTFDLVGDAFDGVRRRAPRRGLRALARVRLLRVLGLRVQHLQLLGDGVPELPRKER